MLLSESEAVHLRQNFHEDPIIIFAWSCQETNRQKDRQTPAKT